MLQNIRGIHSYETFWCNREFVWKEFCYALSFSSRPWYFKTLCWILPQNDSHPLNWLAIHYFVFGALVFYMFSYSLVPYSEPSQQSITIISYTTCLGRREHWPKVLKKTSFSLTERINVVSTKIQCNQIICWFPVHNPILANQVGSTDRSNVYENQGKQ